MQRDAASHKGENGKVAIIGGSMHQHGAPLFAALAAEASGVDLLYVAVPRCHSETAKHASLNFQIYPFVGDELTAADVPHITELLATMDCAVVGPGLDRSHKTLDAIRELVESASCTLVLDASALQPWTLKAAQGKQAVVTPHLGELERMGLSLEEIPQAAKEHGVTFVCKSEVNTVVSRTGEMRAVGGGNAGLTVGGTGDAMAGLLGGLIAQGMDHFQAGIMASDVIKRAGSILFVQYGYAYGTRRVIEQIPHLLATL